MVIGAVSTLLSGPQYVNPAYVTTIHNARNISLLCRKAMFLVLSVRSCETLDRFNCIGSADTIRDMTQLFEYNIVYLS